MQTKFTPLSPAISTAAAKLISQFGIPAFFAADAQGALAGVCEAAFRLGTFFYFRNNGPQDARQAIRWLTPMGKKDSVPAQTRLGACYIRLHDFATAATWLLPAARQNQPKALILLGRCYEELGNKTGARLAYNRYAELGYDRGRRELQRLDELNSKGYGPLLRQVYAGDIQSCYELGRVYLELSRTAATLQEQEGRRKFGLRLLHQAATQGHEAARLLYNQEAQNNHQPEQKLFNEEALRESNI